MKKSKLVIACLLIAVMIIGMPSNVFAQGTVGFILSRAADNVSPGQILEVTISGENLKDLYGYEAVLSFDPSVVEFDKAVSKLDGFSITPLVKDGKATIAFTKVGPVEGENGNVALSTVTFKGKAAGKANVSLVSVLALDSKMAETILKGDGEGIDVRKTFTDLGNHEWARMEIEALANMGIIKGTTETTYSPANNISRADFTALLVRALEFTGNVEDNFDDVTKSDYFYKEVGIAKKNGIADGIGNNKFNPRANVSRQDMMVLVARAMKIAGIELEESATALNKFLDAADIAPYAVTSVNQLVNEGIIIGSNDRINPNGTATRAEAAVIMYRIFLLK